MMSPDQINIILIFVISISQLFLCCLTWELFLGFPNPMRVLSTSVLCRLFLYVLKEYKVLKSCLTAEVFFHPLLQFYNRVFVEPSTSHDLLWDYRQRLEWPLWAHVCLVNWILPAPWHTLMTATITYKNTHYHDNTDITNGWFFYFFFADPQQSYGLEWEWSVGNKVSKRTAQEASNDPYSWPWIC